MLCVGGISFLGLIATLFFTYEMVNKYKTLLQPTILGNIFWLSMFNSYVVVIVNINDKLKTEVSKLLSSEVLGQGNQRNLFAS